MVCSTSRGSSPCSTCSRPSCSRPSTCPATCVDATGTHANGACKQAALWWPWGPPRRAMPRPDRVAEKACPGCGRVRPSRRSSRATCSPCSTCSPSSPCCRRRPGRRGGGGGVLDVEGELAVLHLLAAVEAELAGHLLAVLHLLAFLAVLPATPRPSRRWRWCARRRGGARRAPPARGRRARGPRRAPRRALTRQARMRTELVNKRFLWWPWGPPRRAMPRPDRVAEKACPGCGRVRPSRRSSRATCSPCSTCSPSSPCCRRRPGRRGGGGGVLDVEGELAVLHLLAAVVLAALDVPRDVR